MRSNTMVDIILNSHFYIEKTTYFLLLYLTTITFSLSQDSSFGCVLDIHQTSSWHKSICEARKWGVFVNNCSCEPVFEDYLYALSQRANQTNRIFLNPTEQKDCLLSMKRIDPFVPSCDFLEKLTGGASGCSDFSTKDVFDNLSNTLKSLEEECRFLGSTGELGAKACNGCVERWEEIVASSSNGTESERDESLVCDFSVLATLIGSRAGDKSWIQALYSCLGSQDSTIEKEMRASDDNRKLRIGLWILASSVAGITAIGIFIGWNMYKKRPKDALLPGKQENSPWTAIEETSCPKILVKDVYLATNNLDLSNFIGQGVAGKVYKGILSEGQHVAVKHIIKDGQFETFIREVRGLSHVRHPNLITLIGFCKAVDECFLVYELCHNGNLSEWLFGKDKVLFWIQRLRIALDSAKGLWFLHSYPQGCIVHRDIKPTNILIDDKFQAKLSDFGLSKVMDLDQSYVSSEVRGTFGYVDPEYRANHRVNPSGDVYSFGVVLLQLLSGQRVINLNSTRSRPLTKMARSLVADGDIEEFADPKLKREYSSEAFDIVFNLALDCTGTKQQRPSMKQVVRVLEKALDISTQFNSVS